MALSATVYTLSIELAHIDQGAYESLELRVARQPSETMEYVVTRVLAYCCEYQEGIAFSQGIIAGDEPAVWVRDATGQITRWIEVGMPDSDRLHRGSKISGQAVVYTHRSITQLLSQLGGKKIHRAEEIPIYAFDRRFIDQLANLIERRTAMSVTITEGELFVELNGQSLSTIIAEHRIGASIGS